MRLKLVVLPAPFGPMSATVSPSFTEKLTSWTARRPPNRLLKPLMTSASAIERRLNRSAMRAHAALIGFGDKAHDPGRPPQDHRHQNEAVDRELHAAGRAPEPALQQRRGCLEQHGADDRTPQRANA